MARRLQLEIFDVEQTAEGSFAMTEATFETAKLEAYEHGYSAGWDDCAAGYQQDMAQYRAELANALNEYAFTAREARQAALASLAPVFDCLIEVFVPALAQAGAVERAREILTGLAQKATEPHVTIRAHSQLVPLLEEEALKQTALRITVVGDGGLLPGQVRFCREQGEIRVDLESVREDLQRALMTLMPSALSEETEDE